MPGSIRCGGCHARYHHRWFKWPEQPWWVYVGFILWLLAGVLAAVFDAPDDAAPW